MAVCPFVAPYTPDGRLLKLVLSRTTGRPLAPPDAPLFECNDSCDCVGGDCAYRVVQKGVSVPLQVFTAGSKGLGLRTGTSLKAGRFVAEYAGEVVRTDEAARRQASYDKHGLNYLLCVREFVCVGRLSPGMWGLHNSRRPVPPRPSTSQVLMTCVDATRRGNCARFINHSCEPNCTLVLCRVDALVPHLAVFTKCDVAAGCELTLDYGEGMLGKRGTRPRE